MPSVAKSASLVITLAGGLTNALLTVQLAGSWGTLRALDAESELEAWKLDGLRVLLLWGVEEEGEPDVGRHTWILGTPRVFALFREDRRPSGHLESAPDEGDVSGNCAPWSYLPEEKTAGNKPSHVRLYRDCSSVDVAFTALLTVLAALTARAPVRAAREQPELTPLLALLPSLLYSFGFGSSAPVSPDEAYERALEHAAVDTLAGLIALTVVRPHFLLANGAHYSALVRAARSEAGDTDVEDAPVQRICLLPLPKGVKAADMVYAPLHCPAAANSLLGTSAEVWVCAGAEAETTASTSYAPVYVSAPPSPRVCARVRAVAARARVGGAAAAARRGAVERMGGLRLGSGTEIMVLVREDGGQESASSGCSQAARAVDVGRREFDLKRAWGH
ncbi:hypothetical protein K438DRAFT_1962068 [Mycena galopus ATCC 62051]|nr:hypothetical protein K438DRAFT_1962068 [Mycena galopus ATCC 62051]